MGLSDIPNRAKWLALRNPNSGMSFNSFLTTLVVKEKRWMLPIESIRSVSGETRYRLKFPSARKKYKMGTSVSIFVCNLDMSKRRRNPNTSKDGGKEGHGNPKT